MSMTLIEKLKAQQAEIGAALRALELMIRREA